MKGRSGQVLLIFLLILSCMAVPVHAWMLPPDILYAAITMTSWCTNTRPGIFTPGGTISGTSVR